MPQPPNVFGDSGYGVTVLVRPFARDGVGEHRLGLRIFGYKYLHLYFFSFQQILSVNHSGPRQEQVIHGECTYSRFIFPSLVLFSSRSRRDTMGTP